MIEIICTDDTNFFWSGPASCLTIDFVYSLLMVLSEIHLLKQFIFVGQALTSPRILGIDKTLLGFCSVLGRYMDFVRCCWVMDCEVCKMPYLYHKSYL